MIICSKHFYDRINKIKEELLLDVGFESIELEKMFGIDDKPEDDDVPEVKVTEIKTGDMFQLGGTTICPHCKKHNNI